MHLFSLVARLAGLLPLEGGMEYATIRDSHPSPRGRRTLVASTSLPSAVEKKVLATGEGPCAPAACNADMCHTYT